MQLTPFIKSLEVWYETNKDLPEHSKYNEILESLKSNKEIEGGLTLEVIFLFD